MGLHIFISCIIIFFIGPSLLAAEESVEVVIQGVEAELLENVRSALAVPEGMVKDGSVNRQWLDYFKDSAAEKAARALEPFGYYRPEISAALEDAEGTFRLIVKIDHGGPVRLEKVDVSVQGPGAEKSALMEIADSFPLRKGDILIHSKYEEAKGHLRAAAEGMGFLDAGFTAHRILVSREEYSARIELTLETGPRYFFGETRFEGALEYREKFLRRHLTFRRGEYFSQKKLGATQLNLLNSERFNEVRMTPEKEKAAELRVPVLITLKSAPSRQFKMGVGYGTDTGARISLKYRDLNIFGMNHEFQSDINLSERLQGAAAGYKIPGSKDIDNVTAFLFRLQHEDVNTYENRLISLEANRTKSFKKGRFGTGYVRVQFEESTISYEKINAFFIMPGIRFSQQRYDSLVRPSKGYLYSLELRGTGKSFGSDMNLVQALVAGNVLFPLPWKLSLFARANAGFTAQDEPLRDLPASLRFFAGGDRSVRGYAYQSLGPEDDSGKVIGGKNLLVGSLELERLIFADWGLAVFYDAGNAFNSLSNFTLYQGAGIGLRYHSPVGALRLDLARQIDVDDPDFRIHFTVGLQL